MIPNGLKKWLAFGSGLGVAIEGPRGAEILRVCAVRVRPSGVRIAGGFEIENFEQQPAAEWGAAIAAFGAKLGLRHVPAMIALPRHDVVLRVVSLPGIADKDLDAAIAYQIEGLHPWEEGAVVSSWARLGDSDAVLVGIARADAVNRYATLFAEAGIKLAGFTCSGPAIYSALRVMGVTPASELLAYTETATGIEIYGESPSRPVLSAAFPVELERAASLAAAELRFENAPVRIPLAQLLNAESPLAYAAAVSSACPRLTLALNLLPAEQRQIGSPWRWVPSAVLGTAVLLAAIALAVFPGYEKGRYLQTLEAEIATVRPRAARVDAIDRRIAEAQQHMALLEDLRVSSKRDMDVLAELTERLAPPSWVQSLQIEAQTISVAGEAPEASGLLRLLDDSPYFEASEFLGAPARRDGNEGFRIRARRSPNPQSQAEQPEQSAQAAQAKGQAQVQGGGAQQ